MEAELVAQYNTDFGTDLATFTANSVSSTRSSVVTDPSVPAYEFYEFIESYHAEPVPSVDDVQSAMRAADYEAFLFRVSAIGGPLANIDGINIDIGATFA